SLLDKPVEINPDEFYKYNGEKVKVRGIVRNKIGNLIEITNYDARGLIFYEKNDEINYGDEIEAIGKVGEYGNEFILYANFLKIFKKWDEDTISLPYLLENYEKYVNSNINVTGYIYSVSKSYFYLTDDLVDYKIKVYCENLSLEKGDKVFVKGFFYYDAPQASFFIKINQPYHEVKKYD
ncbi:MAG: hypothetical protein QW762_04220, partial [Candidatus Thermoplasmatota archaeon]